MKTRLWLSVVALGVSLALLTGPGMAAPPPQTPEPPDEPSGEYLLPRIGSRL